MALDTDKLRSHLKDSGLFSDAEIEAEVLSAQKDAKAEERRSILNSTKVEAPPVADSSPAVAASPAAAPAAKKQSILSVPTAPAGTTPADIASGAVSPTGMGLTPEQRVGNVGVNVANAGGNAIQDSLDYARNAVANNPELTGALAAIPLAYGANKLGLFDNLGSKMSANAAPPQPQPFVGGSGPRVTPLAPVVTPAASPIQNWDIHSDPSFGNFLGDGTAPATPAAPVAAPSRNLTIQEAQARMAGVTPAATPVVPEAVAPAMVEAPKPIAPTPAETSAAMPSRPVVPTPPEALASTATPAVTYPKKTTFKTAAEIPEGFVFRPDVGNLDRSMYNILGPEHRQQAKEFLTGGKMFGQSADVNADVSKLTNQYFQRLQSEIPETILGRDARKLQNVPSDFGVYGGKGGFGKAAKVAGIAGTLFAGADLVNAAQRGDTGRLLETAFNVGTGLGGPAVATAAQALMGTNAGLSAEEEARQLRMRNYAERAGRGVAQGYDPRRLIGVAPPVR